MAEMPAADNAIERALRETEGLFAAARAILGSQDLTEICQNLTSHFNQLVQANRTVIYLVDHDQRRIMLRMADGALVGDEDDMSYALLEAGISGLVFKTGQPVLSASTDDGIEPEATRRRRRSNNTGALIVVPLVARGRVIGTVTASNEIGQRVFTHHDINVLMSLATQAATAIDNVRLLEESQRRVQHLESIRAVSDITSAQLDEVALFDLLYREALRITGVPAEKATFFLARYAPDQSAILFDLHYECGVRLTPIAVPLGQGMTSWVIQNNRPLLLTDLTAEQDTYGYRAAWTAQEQATGRYSRACIAVPLRLADRVCGVMSVQSIDEGVLTEDHLYLLTLWSGQVAIALENARLVQSLRRQTAAVQERNEELDTFAHTVAHDIKNLINIVSMNAAMLTRHRDQLNESKREKMTLAIWRSVNKMNSITDELMLLAGLRHDVPVPLEPLNMGRIVLDVQDRLSDLIYEHSPQLVTPPAWPNALGYTAWVEEVWTNYLSNAIKYGGVPPHLQLGATRQTNGMVRFWVHDNGDGIPTDQQPRLFTPFVRLNQIRVEGHGLGLSIVRRIVERLGGQVGVESNTGQGSTFYFTLPAAEARQFSDLGPAA